MDVKNRLDVTILFDPHLFLGERQKTKERL